MRRSTIIIVTTSDGRHYASRIGDIIDAAEDPTIGFDRRSELSGAATLREKLRIALCRTRGYRFPTPWQARKLAIALDLFDGYEAAARCC